MPNPILHNERTMKPIITALTRRLNREEMKAEQSFATIPRTIMPGSKLNAHVRHLRRCDRLKTAIHNLTGGEAHSA